MTAGPAAEVRQARGPDERTTALALRHRVFVEEQGISPAEEHDGLDARAIHLVALSDGRMLGTCRLVQSAPRTLRLGRLAVSRPERHRGIATSLLAHAEELGRERGAARIVLHAQTYACALYAAAGYRSRGEPFMEAGVEHTEMERELA